MTWTTLLEWVLRSIAVFLKEIHGTYQYQKVKNITTFIQTRDEKLEHWQNQQEGRNEQAHRENNFRLCRRKHWQNRSHKPLANGSATKSISADNRKNLNDRYAARLDPPPSYQIRSKNKRRRLRRYAPAMQPPTKLGC